MIIARLKQGIRYIFSRYNRENDIIVKKILTEEEFKIFNNMDEYDKVHSFRLFKMIESDELLKNNKVYQKLALLHDCGKENALLIKRIKKVLVGDKLLDNHSLLSYQKLKVINKELAELAKIHHEKTENILMKRFQKLDDR